MPAGTSPFSNTALLDSVHGDDARAAVGNGTPFATAQKAIDACYAKFLAAPASERRGYTIEVAPFTQYDEDWDITVTGGFHLLVTSSASYFIGDFNTSALGIWAPSAANAKNINILGSIANVNGVRPGVVFSTSASQPWNPTTGQSFFGPRVSGRISFDGVTVDGNVEFTFQGEVWGQVTLTTATNSTNKTLSLYFIDARFKQPVSLDANSNLFQFIRSRMDDGKLLTVGKYSNMADSAILGGVSANGLGFGVLPAPPASTPQGFFGCELKGVFTGLLAGPVLFMFDGSSNASFMANAGTIAGVGQKVLLQSQPIKTAQVDPLAGNDTYGKFGGAAFKTVQAALTAAQVLAAAGGTEAAIHLAPGIYAEEVTFVVATQFNLSLYGSGRTHVARLAALKITTPAANTLQVTVSDISLGASAVQVNPPLWIANGGGAGNLFLTLQSAYLQTPTNGKTVLQADGAGGTCSVSILDGVQISHPGATDTKGIVASGNTQMIFGGGSFEVGSDNNPAVILSGSATFTLNDGRIVVDGGAAANVSAVSSTSTGGITISNASLTPRGDGDGVVIPPTLGVNPIVTVGDTAIIQGAAATGLLVNAAALGPGTGGVALLGRNTKVTPAGGGIPTISAALGVFYLPGVASTQGAAAPATTVVQSLPQGVSRRTVYGSMSLIAGAAADALWTIEVETGVGTGVYSIVQVPTVPAATAGTWQVAYSFQVAGGRRYRFTAGGGVGVTETISRYNFTDEV